MKEFIKSRFEDISEILDVPAEEKQGCPIELEQILSELKFIDPRLSDRVDCLIGNYISIYSRFFFEIGYIEGMKMESEIRDLKERNYKGSLYNNEY